MINLMSNPRGVKKDLKKKLFPESCICTDTFLIACFIYHDQVWDLRKNDMLYRLRGHTDTVTGMQLSPDGSYLLSNSMDNTGIYR